MFSICQSIGSKWFLIKKSLVLLNGLLPKKPLYADNGLGCGASKIKCAGLFSIAFFLCAGAPHKINTMGRSCSFKIRIVASVNSSQPIPLCELA